MKKPLLKVTLCWVSLSCLSASSFGLPIMKLPGGIQTNFMPMLFVKFLGGAFSPGGFRSGTRALAKSPARVAKMAMRAKQKRRFIGESLSGDHHPKKSIFRILASLELQKRQRVKVQRAKRNQSRQKQTRKP